LSEPLGVFGGFVDYYAAVYDEEDSKRRFSVKRGIAGFQGQVKDRHVDG
jgi:hypothetical protein